MWKVTGLIRGRFAKVSRCVKQVGARESEIWEATLVSDFLPVDLHGRDNEVVRGGKNSMEEKLHQCALPLVDRGNTKNATLQ